MPTDKNQESIDQAEWENPDNWSSIYFSKADSRATVPKRNPKEGWTINFGHPQGAKWIYYLLVFFFLLGLGIGVGIAIGVAKAW